MDSTQQKLTFLNTSISTAYFFEVIDWFLLALADRVDSACGPPFAQVLSRLLYSVEGNNSGLHTQRKHYLTAGSSFCKGSNITFMNFFHRVFDYVTKYNLLNYKQKVCNETKSPK